MSGVQSPATRTPRQARARHKVELILEAAIRLLDKGGLPSLTTNAAAETAGVSIGTLYQYFPNKEVILEALADREVAMLSDRVLIALQDPFMASPRDRISHIVRAVTVGYGERPRVHRLVIEYSLSRGGKRIAPLVERIMELLTKHDQPDGDAMSEADAFVLTYAFVGVMRAMIMRFDEAAPKQAEIEEAMTRLITGFVAPISGSVAGES